MKTIRHQLNRKALTAILMVLCMVFPALAQNVTVTGVVYDPDMEPAIGASVMIEGTSKGVATNFDGEFSLEMPADGSIVVSYVGAETQTIALDGRTNLEIYLQNSGVNLDELVVIGYGVVKKEDATGSIAVIKPDDVEAGIAKSVQDMLVGASPGVTVTTNGGNPTGSASIRIRGGSSISASNDPLIVIDGVPQSNHDRNGVSPLTMVNPQDIESMTILKDASATAIYGSRASNGVIIIQTKKGSSGRPKVNFSANWHSSKARKTLKVYDGPEYKELANKLYPNSPNLGELGNENTDWQDLILRRSFSQDYNLSVAGTYKWLPYRVSVGFSDNNGIINKNEMQRTTVGISLNPKFLDNKLSVNVNLNGTYIDLKGFGNEGLVGAAMSYNPTISPYKQYNMAPGSVGQLYNGYYFWMQDGVANSEGQGKSNPMSSLNEYSNQGTTYSSTGNIQIDYAFHFLPDLHANLNLGYEVTRAFQYSESAPGSRGQWLNGGLGNMGSYAAGTEYKWRQLNRNTLLDFYLNYRKTVDEIHSNFDVMAGYSWQRFSYVGRNNTYITTMGYQTNNGKVPYDPETGLYTLLWDESSKANIGKPVTNAYGYWCAPQQLVSFFGRFNYSFMDTYLLTFTLRDDASSRFSKSTRWGLFPSVALGWRISQNEFFNDIRGWWNDFKLRLGWGQTGQQDVGGYFPYLATYTTSKGAFKYPNPTGGEDWIAPLYPNGYDESLKWETTTTWNAGLDFAFMNNRITAAADWYLRDTKDLLYRANIAGTGTAASITRNIGSMRNTGFEITVTARPVVQENFTWTTGINWAYNDAKITELTGDSASDSQPARGLPVGTGGDIQYFTVNQAPFAFRVMEQVYDNSGNPIPGVYVDQNQDGTINDDDYIYYHNPAPKHTFSWNNNFTWKNWDLGFVLRANLGNYVYNGPKASYGYTAQMTQYGWNNIMKDIFLYSDLANDGYHYFSSYFVENASFLRCDNISLGYTFDDLLKNKVNLRVFGVVENPFVITKYKGIDPEVFSGIDSSVYPNPTTFTLGLTLNL